MAGYNRIIMIGNLTRDPDYKQLASGQPVCRLGLASNRQYRNKQTGNMVQEVCFVDIDVFGPQAESCRQYLNKGRPVLIEGRLKFDTWQSPEGQKRNKHSIVADRVVFLSSATSQTENVGVQQESTHNDYGKEAEKVVVEAATKSSSKEKSKDQQSESTDASGSTDKDSQVDTGELAFQDEPPFQDDLPF